MPRKSKTKSARPDWRNLLVDRLDPDEELRDLIDERLQRYAARRTSDDAGPPPTPKG